MPRPGTSALLLLWVSLSAAGCRTGRGDAVLVDELGEGLASYYGAGLQGNLTASGETFDKEQLTAAHRTLAFGTCVQVVELKSGRSVQVRVNDRGPFVEGRIIDVSEAAARQLGLLSAGVAKVRLSRCR